MNFVKVTIPLLFCCLLLSVSQSDKQSNQERFTIDRKIELLGSDGVEVGYARLVNINGRLHLQYRLANRLGVDVSKLAVELIGYDSKENVLGGQRIVSRINLKSEAGTQGMLAIDAKLGRAERLTLKFTVLGSGNLTATEMEDPICANDFCGPNGDCGGLAVLVCKHGLESFDCKQGDPCVCKFTCTPPPPAN